MIPARILDENTRGEVITGATADLILLRENPLLGIENLASIHAAILNGRNIERNGSGTEFELAFKVGLEQELEDRLSKIPKKTGSYESRKENFHHQFGEYGSFVDCVLEDCQV